MLSKQKIATFLWFDSEAEAAAKFYVSIFPNSRITSVMHYGEGAPHPKGSVMSVVFELDGVEYMALNGGPYYKLTPAVSLFVKCETQAEVDRLWDKLLDGGQAQQCGWLTDRYGLCWQIVPVALHKMITDPDGKRVGRVFQALMQMVKLDLPALQRAYDGV